MAGDYAILAPHYDRIGLADFGARVTSRLLNFAQQNGWMGRRILDLGCGTGACLKWFAGHGYTVVGVDNSPEMLKQTQQAINAGSLSASLIEADIRSLAPVERIDLVWAVGVMNDLDSLRDLEAVFKSVQGMLTEGRFFVFDMYTIEGLTEYGIAADLLLREDTDLIVFSRSRYDFERQICLVNYDLFQSSDGVHWILARPKQVLRAYPVQAIASLLRRQHFEVAAVVNTSFEAVDIVAPSAPRVIFVAKKV